MVGYIFARCFWNLFSSCTKVYLFLFHKFKLIVEELRETFQNLMKNLKLGRNFSEMIPSYCYWWFWCIKNHIKTWVWKSTKIKLFSSKAAHLYCNWIPGLSVLFLDMLIYWLGSVYSNDFQYICLSFFWCISGLVRENSFSFTNAIVNILSHHDCCTCTWFSYIWKYL